MADLRIDLAIYPGSRVAKSPKTDMYQQRSTPPMIGGRTRSGIAGNWELDQARLG